MSSPRRQAGPRVRSVENARDRLRTTIRRLCHAVRPVHELGYRTASWPLTTNVFAAPRARRLTRAQLTVWGLKGFSDATELLVSELVTNALRHAPGPYRLTLSTMDDLLRCEVEDTGTVLPQARHAGYHEEGGRGLHLLDLLTCCWGSALTGQGKAVWFELPTQDCSDG